jgi:hypothetical protein
VKSVLLVAKSEIYVREIQYFTTLFGTGENTFDLRHFGREKQIKPVDTLGREEGI